jgi:hypothetical protein
MLPNIHQDGDVDLERDLALVQHYQRGDRQAFEDLCLHYRERLYR